MNDFLINMGWFYGKTPFEEVNNQASMKIGNKTKWFKNKWIKRHVSPKWEKGVMETRLKQVRKMVCKPGSKTNEVYKNLK